MNKDARESNRQSWAENVKTFQLRWPEPHIIRFLNKTFQQTQRKTSKVLDIGCGSGKDAVAISLEGFETYAVDYNASSLKLTRNRASLFGVQVNLVAVDSTALPFKDNFFEAAVAWGLFSHLDEDVREALLEIRRTLNPGSYLFANWRAKDDFFYGLGERVGPNTYRLDERTKSFGLTDTVYSFYDITELKQLYTQTGYDVFNVERLEFWINNLVVHNVWWQLWARKKP